MLGSHGLSYRSHVFLQANSASALIVAVLNCVSWVAVPMSSFWYLYKHLQYSMSLILLVGVGGGDCYGDLFRDDSKIFYLCGHLSTKPEWLPSSNYDSEWKLKSSVIRTTKWGSAGAAFHPCHASSTDSHPFSIIVIPHPQKVLSWLHFHLTCTYIFFFILIKGKRSNPFLPFCIPSFDSSESCNFKLKMSCLQSTTIQDSPGDLPPALLVH